MVPAFRIRLRKRLSFSHCLGEYCAAGEAGRQGPGAAVAGDRHAAGADEWDMIVHEYAGSFYAPPTDRLLRDLTADLSVLQVRLGGTDGAVQRGLARAGGQLAAIAALA